MRVSLADAADWLQRQALVTEPPYEAWLARVSERRDVFLGYCSKSSVMARELKVHLADEGISVMDWATDFRAGRSIMSEVERAASRCRCALFLFTADDPLEGNATSDAMPRDNVVLEAGYFSRARGTNRVLIVREKGVKMPADFGGIIYLTIESQRNWRAIVGDIVTPIRGMVVDDV